MKLQNLHQSLRNLTLKIGAKTSTAGKIFGSVNNIQLAEVLEKEGFEIDRKYIIMPSEQIKTVGNYKATIKLHKEVSIELDFEVFFRIDKIYC